MNQTEETGKEQRKVLDLKRPDPEILTEDPSKDDMLGRKEVASRLTDVIKNQTLPFVISIHGEWGTGKTFMLERWQKDLEKQRLKAIYFNAWEDDFCEDPLLAIVGQLCIHLDHVKENALETILDKIKRRAKPLLIANAKKLMERHFGLTTEAGDVEDTNRDLLSEYVDQASTKAELKTLLGEMATLIQKKTSHPLIFIIDELDRCRPTFAIELLERVKHIFDVPNIVFVLGINRDELCRSLQSIYGEIDTDVYIRRFFDLEFNLPGVDKIDYCQSLMRKLEIRESFFELSRMNIYGGRQNEADVYISFFPHLWSSFGFSLRDMDYCIRSISLVGNSMKKGNATFPFILGLFIALKLRNPSLYRQFVEGRCLASRLLDFVDEEMASRDLIMTFGSQGLDHIEGYLYRAEANSRRHPLKGASAIEQLEILQKGEELTHPDWLSCKTKRSGNDRASSLLKIAEDAHYEGVIGDAIGYIAGLIDLHLIRR